MKVGSETQTMREILERHRATQRCAGCHSRIDPLGFALDRFDAIGRCRNAAGLSAGSVNVVSTLPAGTGLDGVPELRRYLLSTDRRQHFVRQFARKLMQYGLTRELQSGDFHTLAAMYRVLENTGFHPLEAIAVLITSDVFLQRAEE